MNRTIVAWFARNFDIRTTQNPNRISICCPFCVKVSEGRKPADTKFHMGVTFTPAARSPVPCVHCFRCGYSASLKRFISTYEGSDSLTFNRAFRQALESLSVADDGVTVPREMQVPLPEEFEELDMFSVSHTTAIRYLKQRRIGKRIYRMFELGLCLGGEYSGRLVFPIRFENRVVGFTARAIAPIVPKYRFPSGFSAASFLYNYDRASKSDTAVVVEGVFDAIRFPRNAVGLFGKAMSVRQKQLLVKTWKDVVVMLDSDAGEAAYKIQKQLSAFVDCRIATLENGDPADSSKEAIQEALNHTSEGFEVFL